MNVPLWRGWHVEIFPAGWLFLAILALIVMALVCLAILTSARRGPE